MNRPDIPSLSSSVLESLNVVWYERDKSETPEPPLFWRAIWPEGGKPRQGRVNFIATVYLSAPTKQAALREFRRWADLRMQDIPHVVIEQVERAEVPCCPFPCCENDGEAIAGIRSHLT